MLTYRIIILFTCVIISTVGCDAIYRILQKEGAEEKELIGELVAFEANSKVLEVQKLLKLYGYKVGNPDGILGTNTRYAIAQFQEDQGLKVSRFIDKATWQSLNEFTDLGIVVEGELNIEVLQRALNNSGIVVGAIDGKRGPRTDAAIKTFQKDHGLEADGKVGILTLRKLGQYL